MSDYIFVFDMDSTITRQEVLPEISAKIGRLSEMRQLTEATMKGEVPFKTSFIKRVNMLAEVPVSEVNEIVANIEINSAICEFISDYKDRCYVVTGNLDIWISGLMNKLGMCDHYFCSKADVSNDHISKIISVLDKELTVRQFIQPFVVIGDGDNDSGMARLADVAIGFGGVRDIAPSLLRNIDYAFYSDAKCAEFLRKLI